MLPRCRLKFPGALFVDTKCKKFLGSFIRCYLHLIVVMDTSSDLYPMGVLYALNRSYKWPPYIFAPVQKGKPILHNFNSI